MKIKELVENSKPELISRGKSDFVADVYWLLSSITGLSRTDIDIYGANELSADDLELFDRLFARRLAGEPLQYILGDTDFYGLRFYVDENVLIPRFDTENLVDIIVRDIAKAGDKFIDMCCGSGCIGISIAKSVSDTRACLVDISEGALEIARKNAVLNEVKSQVEIVRSDLFAKIKPEKYDFIVSNPPYIQSEVIGTLTEEVKKEPRLALDGGTDGMDFYRRIIPESRAYLKDGGYLLFEIGYDEGEAVSDLLVANGFKDVEVIRDFGDLDRIVKGRYYV